MLGKSGPAGGLVSTPRSNKRHANLIILGFSVGATLLVWELLARCLLAAPLPWKYPQVLFRSDPTLVFALRPNQDAYTADKRARINSRGLRGELLPYERSPRRLRLLFLGDSIAFGFGVNENETVAQRVVAHLGENGLTTEAINSSVPSYNTSQEIAYLEQEGLRYRPDWVIIATCWNDINEKSTVRVSQEGWLLSVGDTEPGTLARFTESETSYAIRNLIKRSRLLYGILEGVKVIRGMLQPVDNASLRTDVLEGRDSPQVVNGWNQVAKRVRRLHELSQAGDFRVLIVAFPIPMALEHSYPRSTYPDRLQRIAAEEGIPFLDLSPIFRSAYRGHESLFIPYDGDHPNSAGHDLAARETVKFIVSQTPAGRTIVRSD